MSQTEEPLSAEVWWPLDQGLGLPCPHQPGASLRPRHWCSGIERRLPQAPAQPCTPKTGTPWSLSCPHPSSATGPSWWLGSLPNSCRSLAYSGPQARIYSAFSEHIEFIH